MNASYTYKHMEYPTDPNGVIPTSTRNKYLFEVTWFSKLVTLILLLTLPVVGFLLGLKYNLDNTTVSPYPIYQNKQTNENLVTVPPIEQEPQTRTEKIIENEAITGKEPTVKQDFDFSKARESIEAIINIEATSASQCKAIAFGDRPCGGPEEFLIYSTLNTDVELLEKLVSEYNYQAERYNLKTGAASICSIEVEPELMLKNGECVEKPWELYR